jgi:hypothetical protein
MVQQPNCPNLYWALTDLPCPLVELRRGAQGDRLQVVTDLWPLRDDAPMTTVEIEHLVSRLSGVMGSRRLQTGQSPRSLRATLEARVKDADRVGAARKRLVEAGCKAGLVKELSPEQVILLDEKRDYEQRRDEGMRLLALAPWQIDALDAEEQGRGGDSLFADLLPHIVEVRRAQGRLEQRVGLLRHVEALRLYGAGHDGKLPESLSAIRVPLPADPFTGKPFEYRVEAGTARLHGNPPRGEESNPRYNVRYEVTLQK